MSRKEKKSPEMETPQERKFEFTERINADESRTYIKKESELNEKELDVLLGNVVKTFNSCPKKVQQSFIQLLVNEGESAKETPNVMTEEVKEEVLDSKETEEKA